jgi:hypothetical protein
MERDDVYIVLLSNLFLMCCFLIGEMKDMGCFEHC